MNKIETIEYVNNLQPLDKLRVYMNYYCNMLEHKYGDYYKQHPQNFKCKTFEDFCNEKI